MNETTRDLRSALEAIAEEDGSAAEHTPAQAQAELARLTSRIRRRRALSGAVATAGAVAAAGVIGVVGVWGTGLAPDAVLAAGPRPVAPAAPSPSERSVTSPTVPTPTPTPTAVPVPEVSTPSEPSDPAAGSAVPVPTPSPDDPETIARAVFAEYLEAWRRGDREALQRLSDVTRSSSWASPLDYTPVVPELYCTFDDQAPVHDEDPVLTCDVDLVGSTHFIMRVALHRTADGQWLAQAGEIGVG